MNLFEAKKILHSFGYTLNESKELVTKFWSVSKAMKQHEVIELSDSEKEEDDDNKRFAHNTEINMLFHPSIRLGWKF